MSVYFEIQVDNPDRAKQVDQRLFGWTDHRAEGTSVEYWRINR